LEATRHVPGDVAECGVFQGGTLLAMGLYLRTRQFHKRLYGFDSFQGFDDSAVEFDRRGGTPSPSLRTGMFNNTSRHAVSEHIRWLGLQRTVTLVPGFFAETLDRVADHVFSFVHLDCDLYESYKYCLEFFYPRVSSGGVLLFDEYNDPGWTGATPAIDEFLSGRPERPVEIQDRGYLKYYVKKM
jgi:hypothetical protein